MLALVYVSAALAVDPTLTLISHVLVRLISIWYCNWFMLFMTLDMPDEGTR